MSASASPSRAEESGMKVEIIWDNSVMSFTRVPYDLKDKKVVEKYWAKYNVLYVKLVGEEEPEAYDMEKCDNDYKRPSEIFLWRLRENKDGDTSESSTDEEVEQQEEVVEDVASLSITKN
jgi:hypothetical protein